MDYKVVYTKHSQKDLKRLGTETIKRILRKVDEYSKLDDPLNKAKKLKGFDVDTYRFRIGDYRAVFRLDPKSKKLIILIVIRIAHRKEVYEKET